MKKYLPFIIVYTIYASIVLIVIADERGHHFWEPFIGWLITAPLIVGGIGYFVWKHFFYVTPDEDEVLTYDEKLLFIENWSLVDFTKKYGPKVALGTCTNKTTGEQYKACSFTQEDGTRTYVSFFSKLGELTASEILERKEDLKVGITKEGKYYLHNGNVKAWEDVDLGL